MKRYREKQKSKVEAQPTVVKTNDLQLLRRMIKFCVMMLESGCVEALPQELMSKLSSITDPVRWLNEWCDIYGVVKIQ
jgi:hypothetical protein